MTSITKVNKDSYDSIQLSDNDSVFIREYKINSVEILGAVRNPGIYNVKLGTTLSELVGYAGGYDKSAYPFGGYLENKLALKVNQDSKEKLFNSFLESMFENGSSFESQDETLALLLEQIQSSPVTGRVIAEFDLDLIETNKLLDTILEDGDKIIIPNLTQQVFVQGKVSNPGAIRYVEGEDYSFYLEKAGGVLKSGDTDNIFIVLPNGETYNYSNVSKLSFLAQDTNKKLIYPGSIIYVPQSTSTNPLQTAAIWVPILSSLALSITSLSVLNNQN